jgi:hypothetical protein
MGVEGSQSAGSNKPKTQVGDQALNELKQLLSKNDKMPQPTKAAPVARQQKPEKGVVV